MSVSCFLVYLLVASIFYWVAYDRVDDTRSYRAIAASIVAALWPALALMVLIVMVVDVMTGARRQWLDRSGRL